MSRLGQHDVGHEGVITGRDSFSLRSPIADPQGVTQPSLQSTYISRLRFNNCYPQLLMIIPIKISMVLTYTPTFRKRKHIK
ncbi:hypothetical protein LSPCS325_48100 [Lysinibacillus sp. CTST325]